MHLSRRELIATLAGAACMGTWPARAAEAYPNKAVKLIVAFAPGTGSDALARIVVNAMTPLLGQPIIVDNRSGAGGALGTEQGARSPADGYTLTLVTTSTLLTTPLINANVHYRAEKDFVPVAGIARSPFVILTADTPGAPRTLAELARRLEKDGGSFGSAGVGTITHLASELFLKRANVKAVHVPYRGSTAALTDVAGGQLLFGCDTLVAALPLVRGNRLRALAVTSAERLPALPQVPTVAEALLPGFQVSAWWGIAAPAGTPADVVQRLSQAAQQALGTPEVKSQFAAQLVDPMPLGAAAFDALIRSELPGWTDFVRQTGIRVES
ncbi:tripartite tricarboxylate transporter substrate-binding protein [Variovorax sp. J22R133]|uniref:Bug family tripartite tricarboxylate transporter substrate binding protein n=1 Tax=Variovorax brevis TaxID=3053503 RepID=UPI002576560F|nr:tripartite tricarboxylate transporter substrate-binding protein [Variovorax sp. J22R133]MDM0115422.1 tripartite tricarboxylate transporter substrate-binding protein [Variovorax sp. J22R133]